MKTKRNLFIFLVICLFCARLTLGFSSCEGLNDLLNGTNNSSHNSSSLFSSSSNTKPDDSSSIESDNSSSAKPGNSSSIDSDDTKENLIPTEGIEYTLSNDGASYAVSGYTGSATEIVIPNQYNGLPVTSISTRGSFSPSPFSKCTHITLPNSLISICDYAFQSCSSLTSIIIPEGVTSIGSHAFSNCSSLISVDIPKSVTSIGSQAFNYCSSLTSIVIPDSVTSLGNFIFNGCNALQYNIYDNAKYLGNENNPYLVLMETIHKDITNFTIHKDTQLIGPYAINGCANLTNIVLGGGIISIGPYAFSGCSNLTSITVASENTVYHSEGNCLIETASGTLLLGCKNSVIPNGVASIGVCAFINCSSLTIIIIPESITSIGNSAFSGCNGLTSVYYKGSSENWDNISIGQYGNTYLTNAARYYYSEAEPTEEGNYWRYVDGEIVVW